MGEVLFLHSIFYSIKSIVTWAEVIKKPRKGRLLKVLLAKAGLQEQRKLLPRKKVNS
jgi:hypothetical protein